MGEFAFYTAEMITAEKIMRSGKSVPRQLIAKIENKSDLFFELAMKTKDLLDEHKSIVAAKCATDARQHNKILKAILK